MVEWRGGKGSLGSWTYSHGSALSVEDSECLFHCTFHHHYLITFSIGLSQSSSSEWQFVKPLIAQDFPSNATVHLGPSGSRCVRPRQEQLVGIVIIFHKDGKCCENEEWDLFLGKADKTGSIETIITIIRWSWQPCWSRRSGGRSSSRRILNSHLWSLPSCSYVHQNRYHDSEFWFSSTSQPEMQNVMDMTDIFV